MVRDVFRLAKENAPAIIFIDEVDAIATARFDAQTGADREVQRILMELLNQVGCEIFGYLQCKRFSETKHFKSAWICFWYKDVVLGAGKILLFMKGCISIPFADGWV